VVGGGGEGERTLENVTKALVLYKVQWQVHVNTVLNCHVP
jgi:hypothetical protein